MEVAPVVGFEDEAEIDRRVLDLVIAQRLVVVIVAFVFQLERQRVPRALKDDAAGGRESKRIRADAAIEIFVCSDCLRKLPSHLEERRG